MRSDQIKKGEAIITTEVGQHQCGMLSIIKPNILVYF
jgi:hypothetical protein